MLCEEEKLVLFLEREWGAILPRVGRVTIAFAFREKFAHMVHNFLANCLINFIICLLVETNEDETSVDKMQNINAAG